MQSANQLERAIIPAAIFAALPRQVQPLHPPRRNIHEEITWQAEHGDGAGRAVDGQNNSKVNGLTPSTQKDEYLLSQPWKRLAFGASFC